MGGFLVPGVRTWKNWRYYSGWEKAKKNTAPESAINRIALSRTITFSGSVQEVVGNNLTFHMERLVAPRAVTNERKQMFREKVYAPRARLASWCTNLRQERTDFGPRQAS
jgi:hypothetical protein